MMKDQAVELLIFKVKCVFMLPNTNSEKFHLGHLMPFTGADLVGEFLGAK